MELRSRICRHFNARICTKTINKIQSSRPLETTTLPLRTKPNKIWICFPRCPPPRRQSPPRQRRNKIPPTSHRIIPLLLQSNRYNISPCSQRISKRTISCNAKYTERMQTIPRLRGITRRRRNHVQEE